MVGRLIDLVVAVAVTVVLSGAAVAEAQSAHRVRAGDSMARIARRNGVSVASLAAANRLSPSAAIREGQVLVVPERGTVYVRAGQTLSHIARENDCDVDALAAANRMRRGATLRVGQVLRLPGYEAVARAARPAEGWGEPAAPGTVRIRTRDEHATIRLRDAEGRVLGSGLTELARVMHRHDASERRAEQTNAVLGAASEDGSVASAPAPSPPRVDEATGEEARSTTAPHPRLALLLAAVSDHFGGREIAVVSGFREARRYTRDTSSHVHGQAVDIHVAGVPARELWDFCRSLRDTGCGLYPRSTFVHVDIRKQAAQWVDWSGPGQRPRYGSLRGPYRRRGRQREPIGRSITRPDLVPRFLEVVEAEPFPALPRAERGRSTHPAPPSS
jgi:LysM repeat protein